MTNRLKYNKGDEVYAVIYGGILHETKVTVEEYDISKDLYKVKEVFGGQERYLEGDRLYGTKQEAREGKEEFREKIVLEDMEKLKSVKDLFEYYTQEIGHECVGDMGYFEKEVIRRKIEEFDRILEEV